MNALTNQEILVITAEHFASSQGKKKKKKKSHRGI